MIFIINYIIGWVLTVIYHCFHPAQGFVYNACLGQLVFTLGLFGFFSFTGHVFMREKVAKSIGWISNGFQIELGIVSLGIGICGIMCYWFRDGFWVATAIPFSIFMFGAAILHMKEMIKEKNYCKGNVVTILPDIFMPLTIIVLLFLK